MRYRMKSKLVALSLCGLMGALLAPGCDKLGLSGGGGGGSGGAGGGGTNALASADPTQVGIAALEAGYAAYWIEMMIQQNVPDPSTADDATLQQLADQYAPGAGAAAKQWVASLDPSAVPLFTPDPDKMASCIDKFGCAPVERCPFTNGNCWLVGCGDANCSACPTNFQPTKLLFTGWCVHVCVSGSPPSVVGYKAMIHFRGGATYPYCYQIANSN